MSQTFEQRFEIAKDYIQAYQTHTFREGLTFIYHWYLMESNHRLVIRAKRRRQKHINVLNDMIDVKYFKEELQDL